MFMYISEIKLTKISGDQGSIQFINFAAGGNKLIRVDQITYVTFAMQIVKVGGKFSAIYGLVSFITNLHLKQGWETNILESVFDTLKLDDDTI